MDILSIGNSFSQDAQRYLHQIAKADGVDIHSFNLYIGGCPLSKHYRNMLSEESVYTLEMNGSNTGFYVCCVPLALSLVLSCSMRKRVTRWIMSLRMQWC